MHMMTGGAFYEDDSKLLTSGAFEFVLDSELKRAVRSQNYLTLVTLEATREWEGMAVTADAITTSTVRLLGPDDVLVSFQRPALEEARLLRPGLRTVQHVVGGPIRRARGAWAAGFPDARATDRRLEAAAALGLETLIYTVNDPGRMRALAQGGASGIFTDEPGLAVRVLRGSDRE